MTREIDRLSNLELKVESAMALDARLKALEDGLKQTVAWFRANPKN